MAIQIEFSNVILRKSAVERRFPGGLDGFAGQDLPNLTEDDYLLRVGFMSTYEAHMLVERVESAWLRAEDGVEAAIAIVQGGDQVPSWLEVGVIDDTYCCWLREQLPGEVARPEPGFVLLLPFTVQADLNDIVRRCGAELKRVEAGPEHDRRRCSRGDAALWLDVIENRPSGGHLLLGQRLISRRRQFGADVALLRDLVSALEEAGARQSGQ
jgi:hypothetical protein